MMSNDLTQPFLVAKLLYEYYLHIIWEESLSAVKLIV